MVYPEPICSKLQNDSVGLQPLSVDCLARTIQEPTIITAGTGLHALLSYKMGMGELGSFQVCPELGGLDQVHGELS